MKKYFTILLILFQIVLYGCQSQNKNISAEVKENIKARVDNGINTGLVVGVITSDGVSYYSYGVKSLETKEPVDENSVFEIGSISKTFTGILLADMVVKGELNLDTPLQELLPEGVTSPIRNGESIKLYQMSNHTSSLPGMPDNFNPANLANPYADYSEEQMYAFLNSYELTRDIGSKYEYSNYAQGLLGHVLANKKQMTYEELMVKTIAKPLKLENTRIAFTPKMKENLAMGHSAGVEVENWDIPTLAGAGAIRSTTVDMLTYLAANMGLKKSDLYPAMHLSHKNSTSKGSSSMVGLGWHIRLRNKLEIAWHAGGTGGYRAFAGFIKGGDKGVVVLTNSDVAVDDIVFHLLDPTSALNKPQKPSFVTHLKKSIENEGIEVATRTYWELKKNRTDKYDFGENQLNGLGYSYLGKGELEKAIAVFKLNMEAFPNSFNVYDSYGDALMKNKENEKAIASYKKSVEINPGNTNGIAMLKKLGVDTESLVKEVTVEDAILESYVGNYKYQKFIMKVTKDGKQMKIQITGQNEIEIYPKSENVFYLKVVPALITFNKTEQVESLTLSQGGQEIIYKR
ncbi:serine hydrolase [Labilibaculum antarcticum]|uniref:Beta-lactamase n=1 Tax=Labilibaculum antarcticum TaxID=1717717 RepID=A0A1Y1CNZ7_9BACT|nr:serine hydrolase [Labilibaculum antarcticum]BAX82136.1 CubicO group peptidase, beta-lactamase class C family [Labilibaculum antarcticum]